MVKEIKAAGGKAVSNHMDIATAEGGEGLVNQAIKEFGKLDILVNVAGILRDRMIFNMAEQEWDDVIRVHLKGHYCTMRPALGAYARAQVRQDHQLLVELGARQSRATQLRGGQGGNSGPDLLAANSLHKYGITVNAIMPGASTRMTDTIPAGRMPGATGIPQQTSAKARRAIPPTSRRSCVFLASDEAANVTGQCFGASGYPHHALSAHRARQDPLQRRSLEH